MKKDDIAYSKKREMLMMNQINQLKKVNRELVSRIKNYKGTDLVEISINKNKADILKEYDHPPNEEKDEDFSRIESLSFRLCE